MKKYLLVCLTVFTFGVAMAQLKVESSGDVLLTKNLSIGTPVDTCATLNLYRVSQNPYGVYGVKSHVLTRSSAPTSSIFSVYGFADATATTTSIAALQQVVGVYGKAMCSTANANKFSAGVVGVAHSNRGVGVYGTITSDVNYTLPSGWGATSYAGYFAGNVRVTGTMSAATVTQTSDYRLKTDIQDLQSATTNQIMNLRPVSYKFNPADTINYVYSADAKEMQVRHYGLIAQEVQNILPDLVYENGDGILSINYIELIPLLISTLQEQQQQIADLQAQIANNESENQRQLRIAPKQNEASIIEQAVLYQNNPNPFSVETQIKYLLPQSTENATLYVYNMNGLQLAEYPISSFGEGSVVVSAGSLQAGMYLYSLVANGQIIDTKRMILTK